MSPARFRTPLGSVLVTVLAAGSLLALMTWAATSGPQPVLRSSGDQRTLSLESTSPAPQTGLDTLQRQQRGERRALTVAPSWVRLLAGLLEALCVAAAAYLLWRLASSLLARWRARQRPHERATRAVDLGVLGVGANLAAAIDADADVQLATLDEGEARNAIVACWHRFETTAERAGVRRSGWQTPSEFVLDVLEQAGADAGAVTRLAELYREARFSDHPLTEEHRRRAQSALQATHASLGHASAPTQQPAR